MIAEVSYEDSDLGAVSLVLHEGAIWTGDDSVMVESLNQRIAVEDRSPSAGDWLVRHANEVAENLGAQIEIEPKQAAPAGTVY